MLNENIDTYKNSGQLYSLTENVQIVVPICTILQSHQNLIAVKFS